MSLLSDPNFVVGVTVGVALVFMMLGFLWIGRPWARALFSGTYVPALYVMGMRLRGAPVDLLVDAYVALRKAGEPVDLGRVEAVYLANRGAIRNEQDLVHRVREAVRQLGDSL